MRRTVLAATAVGGLLLLTACGSQKGGSTDVQLAPAAAVKAAATATKDAGSARITLTMDTKADGQTIDISSTGTMTLDGTKADLTTTMPGKALGASGDVTIRSLVDDGTIYLQMTGVASLPATWFKVTKSDILAKSGLSSMAGAGSSVSDSLEILAQLGEVTEVGQETVSGVSTTHYRATVDGEKLASMTSRLSSSSKVAEALKGQKIPVDLWIDADKHVVKLTETFTITAGGKTVEESVTSQLSDFGVPVSVTPPKDAVDIAGLLGGK